MKKMKMKAVILKFSWLIIFLLTPCFHINGALTSHSQQIVKKYKINKESRIYINNKYGKVHVSNWNKDSVRIEIDLLIRSSNYSKVYKIKDNIDFDFVNTKYNLSASTVFGSRYNSIFADLIDIAESFVSTDNQVTIDYTVTLPLWANLNIEHKYGDIFIDDFDGDLNINLSNGDLKANKLNGPSLITLTSADADIYYVNDAKAIITYADFKIKSANKLDVVSKSSNIFLDRVSFLKMDSRRDKYYITAIDKVFGDTYFSDISISEITEEVSCDMKYGNMEVDKIAGKFGLINLSSEYTDITLVFDRNTSYNFDMTHFNELSFSYPKELSNLQEKLIDEETSEYLVYGSIGVSETVQSKVNLKAYKKCYIRLEHK